MARFCLQRCKEKSAKWACGKASILLIKGRNSQGYPLLPCFLLKNGYGRQNSSNHLANTRRPTLG